jgi:hypothetical protein
MPRPVELGDHRLGALAADLIDPVLAAVAREQAAVTGHPEARDGSEHTLGR